MRTGTMKTAFATLAICAVPLAGASAQDAQDVPTFMKEIFPERGVEAAWQEYLAIEMSEDAVLDPKIKQLIGLGVSAQIPCDYCIYFHTKAAKAHGASEAELKEAMASASLVRQWSTMLNGAQYDEEQWREEVDAMFSQ